MTEWAWHHSKAKRSAKAVLVKIADNANDRGEAWPSVGYLMRTTGYSESTVHRAIRTLTELGELVVVRNGGMPAGGRPDRATNLFRIVTGAPGRFGIAGAQADRSADLRGGRAGAAGQRAGSQSEQTTAEEWAPPAPPEASIDETAVDHHCWLDICRENLQNARRESPAGSAAPSRPPAAATPASGHIRGAFPAGSRRRRPV
jgi:DNA-binding transcriptional MocR family regulator